MRLPARENVVGQEGDELREGPDDGDGESEEEEERDRSARDVKDVPPGHPLEHEKVETHGRRDLGHFDDEHDEDAVQTTSMPAWITSGWTTEVVSTTIEMPSRKHPRIT